MVNGLALIKKVGFFRVVLNFGGEDVISKDFDNYLDAYAYMTGIEAMIESNHLENEMMWLQFTEKTKYLIIINP